MQDVYEAPETSEISKHTEYLLLIPALLLASAITTFKTSLSSHIFFYKTDASYSYYLLPCSLNFPQISPYIFFCMSCLIFKHTVIS